MSNLRTELEQLNQLSTTHPKYTEKKAELEKKLKYSSDGEYSIFDHAFFGNFQQVKSIFEADPANTFPCMINPVNDNPLISEAIIGKNKELVMYLVDMLSDKYDSESYVNACNSKGITPLLLACGTPGFSDVFDALVSKGADSAWADQNGETCLFYATRSGDADTIKAIFDESLIMEYENEYKETPICYASSVEILRALCDEENLIDWNANYKDMCGQNALFRAIEHGCSLDELKILIEEMSISPNDLDDSGESCLWIAVKIPNYLDVISYLCDVIDNFDARNEEEENILFPAVSYGSIETLKFLHKEKKMDLTVKNDDDQDLLWYALHYQKDPQNAHAVVKYLLENGVKIRKGLDCPVLFEAASCQNENIVALIVNHNGDVNELDEDGNSVLIHCAKYASVPVINYLLKQGANVNHVGEYENTAILEAASGSNFEVLEILVNKGADLHCVNDDGENVLDVAKANLGLVQYLVKQGVSLKDSFLEDAVYANNLELLQYLDKQGLDFSYVDDEVSTLLHHAYRADIPVIEYLLNKNIDVNAVNDNGDTPLLTFVEYCQVDCNFARLDLLIKHGADIHCKNEENYNLLSKCAYYGREDTIRHYLVPKISSLDYSIINDDGKNLIHIALDSTSCTYSDLKLYTDNGVDINAFDGEGNSAFHVLFGTFQFNKTIEMAYYMVETLGFKQFNHKNDDDETESDKLDSGIINSALTSLQLKYDLDTAFILDL
eukprot:TRINITY_DN11184_c0_g1_i1.p1 TRINITY_DN11184_c0_g1~~TRINITY_DN11184_c0_g1_i1.p1  ORF type:complete len:725 (+),score=179.14 TRINITY_DN11184_c0_g1_i1:47-2221(+)